MSSEVDTQVYPFVDEDGYTWVDPSGMIPPNPASEFPAPCFICNRLTRRIDIDYQGYFCNSYPCIMTIDLDLRGVTDLESASGEF